ncbi:EamA-like transporter family [Musa troglodytarum]|uniref:EamA-like transporter family n=1 Tax=Musa troglodytarum TaxID=320322 RepID=A0A9E7GM20_9LILI|nr:EamA-like transporter family [Musa troglodytarum]
MGDSLLAECKPGLAMVVSQCIYAAMALSAKAAFARGMSPMVFSVYRQATAALVLAPINITARSLLLGLCCFAGWVSDVYLLASSSFQFSLPEDDTWNSATINQCFYYTGLSLSSSSMAMAMTNLTPAITFVIAAFTGLEKVEVRSMRSMAKVFGTVTCVGGAVSMAFFKGPRLLNMEMEFHKLATLLHSASKNWIVGSLLLMGSSCCWSLWLVLQGVFGSGVTFYLQSWTISVKGPLYSAMFNPLGTVITTISACLVLHEQLHIGSLVAAVAVVGGLYVVLWGKAKDIDPKSSCSNSHLPCVSEKMTVVVDPGLRESVCDLQKPLLRESLGTQDNQMED